ncbi:hypothetical protein GXB81_26575 [Paraburkholderia sp. Ac-20336]|uniref:hypothetical protein n=1 Tax=unclassified Paraburkholderia TaxID=2615204 RepID=UPI001422DF33|nr:MULTISPECIES: hypothetical protein [unclassified Paraburkholderia]MBN3806588.1 hypothetical protein [Paraburkholderia sp. Ac-20336]MBN3851178.1 hypothetical protein [Paraburkholderia sp. Ac-20342]NIF79873.1 hypothetical protein [Paraburkholderia sp. Cy-641]
MANHQKHKIDRAFMRALNTTAAKEYRGRAIMARAKIEGAQTLDSVLQIRMGIRGTLEAPNHNWNRNGRYFSQN